MTFSQWKLSWNTQAIQKAGKQKRLNRTCSFFFLVLREVERDVCSLDQSQGKGNQNYIEILDYFGYFIVKFSVVTNTFGHLAYLILITVNPLTPISDQDRISPYNINTISTR